MKRDKTTTEAGALGEEAAARYLEQNGYEILKQNYRVAGSEVDLIALKGETVCFVEVKTRGTDDFGLPEEFVDERKRRKIIRAARIYTGNKKYENHFVRFDIVSVLHNGKGYVIRHIQHAFEG